jgi:LuxR family maltose regulon positive regulatory protein
MAAIVGVKLRPPSASPAQVVRRAIVDLVCAERAARLVLIRAPAGFGKTTTMVQCRNRLQEEGVRTAWLTLDRSDNDASRFLSCLTAALAGLVNEDAGERARDVAPLPILAALEKSRTSFALFIDELDLIHEPGVIGLLRQLIAGLPDCGRVVIGTRSVPDLSLARLRARGHLLEIDAELLRFSQAETDEYVVERRGIPLDARDRMLLHRKTEGWVAGLWLASAALARHASRGDFIARFSGSNVAVAEYLADDVLDLQPPALRSFLMRTSILRELNPSLCQALVPDMDCDAVLRRLEAENVLVTSVDGEARSYRYHGLFAGFLRAQLAREAPAQVAALHAAASRWFEENGRPVRAIDHALEGGDFPNALRLLELHAMALLAAGRMRLLSRWLEAIPAGLMATHPRLRVARLWSIGLTRGPRDALAELDRGELDACTDPEVRAHVMVMRPSMLVMSDELEEGYRLGMECLAKLSSGIALVDSVLLSNLANVSVMRRRPDEALRLLDQRRRILGSRSVEIGDMHAECILGTVAMFEGRLAEATAHFRTAVTTTASHGPRFTKGNVWAGILYAMVVYEAGALDEVRNLLQVYVPIARDAGIPDNVTLGYRLLCRLAFGSGDVDDAFLALAELESLGYQRQYARVVASARLERSRIQLLQGHFKAAADELERGSDPAVWAPLEHLSLLASEVEYPELCRLRWEAYAGDASAAVEALGREIAEATSVRRAHRALKLRVLRAGALERSGERERALDEFRAVARLCYREGFVRIAADEAPLIVPLARHLAEEGGAQPAEPQLVDWLRRLRDAAGEIERFDESPAGRGAAPTAAHPAADHRTAATIGLAPDKYQLSPLTPKEQRVLKLLAEGYSNAAMSEKLFVSDSTVRTHLRNINSKLGVRSRAQAVVAARRLGLLH